MKGHVALVPIAEVGDRVFRPLVRFGEQHSTVEALVDVTPQFLEEGVRRRKIFAVRTFLFVEIWNRIEPKTIHAEVEPKIDDRQKRLLDVRVLEIEIRLVRIK